MGSKKSKLKDGATKTGQKLNKVCYSSLRFWLVQNFRFGSCLFEIVQSLLQFSHAIPASSPFSPSVYPWSCGYSPVCTLIKKQEIKELAEKTNFTVEGIFLTGSFRCRQGSVIQDKL